MATNQPKSQSQGPALPPTILIVPKVSIQQDKPATTQSEGTSSSVTTSPHTAAGNAHQQQQVLVNLPLQQSQQLTQNPSISLGNNITLTVQPTLQGGAVSQIGGTQFKFEGATSVHSNKVGAFLKPPVKLPIQVPQRVYKRSVAAIQMQQLKQLEKQAKTGGGNQQPRMPSQPTSPFSAVLLKPKQGQGSVTSSLASPTQSQVVTTAGKPSTGSPTSTAKSQPVLVQTAMSPKIIVQAAPTGTQQQGVSGKSVLFTGGRFTILPSTQGGLISPTAVAHQSSSLAATMTRTSAPTVAQLAKQQRMQKMALAVVQQQQQQQQQQQIASSGQRPLALKQASGGPVAISPGVTLTQTQLQAMVTSTSTAPMGQFQFTPRMPLTITTQAQQLQQQQIQALTPKTIHGKITLGQVGAISNVHHIASTTQSTNPTNMPGTVTNSPGNIVAQQAPLTIIPKQTLAGTSYILSSTGIHQVPTSLQGTYLQPGSAPLSNPVQAKLIQTPVPGGVSTHSGFPANIMLQAVPQTSQAQLKGSSPGSQTPLVTVHSSNSASVVQPQLIQTCGAQATIGLIHVNLSQQSQQSLATVNSLNHPIVRATIQAPLQPSADGTNQPMLTYRPQLVQVTGLPNQQYFQVVAQPQHQTILPMTSGAQVTQAAASVTTIPVVIAPRVASPKLCMPHPILTPFESESANPPVKPDPVSSVDVALKYKMPYPQAPIPHRKRKHSEREDVEEKKTDTKEEPVKKEEISEEDSLEFNWEDYLEITGSKAAPHSAFKHVEASIQSGIAPGMKLEVLNKHSAFKSYWVATVVAACSNLLSLRYGGYDSERSGDFWVDMATADIHPIGWCALNGRTLRPPDDLLLKFPQKNWEEFLINFMTWAKSVPEHVLHMRKVSSPTPVDRIKKGMRVEVLDELNPRHAWIAIIKETYGGRLRLRYAAVDDDGDDFWLFYLSWRVHPIDWAKEKLVFMKPPPMVRRRNANTTEAGWNTIHQYALSAARREASFPKELFKDQPKIRCHRFKKGMRLEAINPKVPSQICPATVSEWLNDKAFLVTIDNLIDEKCGQTFMCHADSGGIFPVNWCEKHGYGLTPPKGFEGAYFQWSTYLKERTAKPAPRELFRIFSREHEFRPSMKVEAVNPFSPAEICVATITKVVNRHMWIHFDNSKLPNLVVDSESHDIFPVGWCESNGYILKAPKKLMARKAKKVAIVWPEKHRQQPTFSQLSPGRDLYQKIQRLHRDEDSAAGHGTDWTTKVYFNHKCFSGPFLSKGRIAELPKAVGPGIVVLVLREVLSLLINAAYKPPRVLKELEIENEETAGMNGHLQVMKAKYKGKSYRALVEICKTSGELTDYLRTTCIKLECCPNLISLKCVADNEECQDGCTNLTKTKYTYQYGKKKKFHHIGRPPGRKTTTVVQPLPPPRKGNKRRKKRKPFVHRKKHSLLTQEEEEQLQNGQDGDRDAGIDGEDARRQDRGGMVKKKNQSQTMAHALLQSARRKKIHPVTPKLVLPHRERGTKMKTFAAILTSNRAQKKAAKEKPAVLPAVNHDKAKTKAFVTNSKPEDRLHLTSNPLKWTTSEVVKFINKTDCATLARIFEEQEIDGQALLLLTLPTVQECMDLKLGPAIKLCHHIERVKIAFYDQFAK